MEHLPWLSTWRGPIPPHSNPSKPPIIGTWVVGRARLDIVLQTSSPHPALKESPVEKAQAGEEGTGVQRAQGPASHGSAAAACRDKRRRCGRISLALSPSSMGAFWIPALQCSGTLLTDLSCGPEHLPHPSGLYLHDNALFGGIIA